MTWSDITIIYLACGAPFGVYSFLAYRHREDKVWIRSLLTALFWIPFALRLLLSSLTEKLNQNEFFINFLGGRNDESLISAKKSFEIYLPRNGYSMSLYELREIINRYSGLTLARNAKAKGPAGHEQEIFRIDARTGSNISAVCLNRRNHSKLSFHQKESRNDFLEAFSNLLNKENEDLLGKKAIEFVKLLKDEEALASIQTILETSSRNTSERNVKELENDLWKPERPIQPKDEPIPLRLKTLTAMANARTKD
ncbi:MAG: hypothetical protein HKN25_11530 [Pyrinomonadaceae bacterium]|nr:hypothetical protein [Pyrinomonadaceae bacterium]